MRLAMQRKAVSLSLNVVIIAVLGLLVLAVLGYIILNSTGTFAEGTNSCQAKGGVCAYECGEGSAVDHPIPTFGGSCSDEFGGDQKCCLGTG